MSNNDQKGVRKGRSDFTGLLAGKFASIRGG
jgi:hypothetical protein